MLLCVPDHWHARMAIDAMEAGKAVYCEKPMVRTVEEGPEVIAAQEKTKAVFQVGSQYASSILYDKVRDLIAGGAIGKLNAIEARYNRNSPIGAWQYSIPTDASPETVDWDRFLGDAPKRPFDADPRSSAGGTTGTTARPSPATCSSTCSPASTTPPARWGRRGSRRWAAGGTGRTAATSTT